MPPVKPPPWIHTITGSDDASPVGRETLRKRQSSSASSIGPINARMKADDRPCMQECP